MVKLNRSTEYALIALRSILAKRERGDASVTSAREIADRYGLPFEITAKTLQRMKDVGLIQSAQGARGGYTLGCAIADLSVAEFLERMEGPQAVVDCAGEEPRAEECAYGRKCEVKGALRDLNDRVKGFLGSIRLVELADFTGAAARPVPAEWVTPVPRASIRNEVL